MTVRPLVVATVTAETSSALVRERDRVAGADLIELRLDTVRDPNAPVALAGRRTPAIVTCRTRAEGGLFQGSEDERRAILNAAFEAGAEFVDLEWRSGFDAIIHARGGRGIVLSHHDFSGVPADLGERVEAMLATGCEVVKAAVMARTLCDAIPLLEIARRHRGRKLVLIAMADAGLVTRVFAARLGSCWTYAGAGAAPGQITVEQMTREFRVHRIGAGTAMYGLFGRPIGQSPSPAMHNAGFEASGIDAAYVPLPAANAADAMRFAEAFDMSGASVTVPFKTDVARGIGAPDAGMANLGSVNTIARRDGKWAGTSTDGSGFMAGLGGRRVSGLRAAILGTGGAARAVAAALRQAGAGVTVYGRRVDGAAAVARDLSVAGEARPVPAGSWDLLVNATPLGTRPAFEETAFPEGTYDGRIVYDLVYTPAETRLLRDARLAGCDTIGGLAMLVEQARLQQQWWTGRAPDGRVMQAAAEWKLASLTDPV